MSRPYKLLVLVGAMCWVGCAGMSTAPERDVSSEPITRLLIFVRDSPVEDVEVDLSRTDGKTTVILYRPEHPAQGNLPATPRILLDSIGPSNTDPPEIVELMKNFDVWKLADSNAVGAACSTKSGEWVCYPTFNDYSLVMQVIRGGVSRAQRYTNLRGSNANKTARALGDFIFAWKHKHEVNVPAAILQRYVGDWKLESGTTVSFRRDGTTLFVKPGSSPEVFLVPRSDTRFLDPRGPVFEFQVDAEGNVTGLILEQGNPVQRTSLTRIR